MLREFIKRDIDQFDIDAERESKALKQQGRTLDSASFQEMDAIREKRKTDKEVLGEKGK